MITITNATIYSINKATEMAYQVEYSNGTVVRVVESKDQIIRNEYKKNGEWVQSGKAYIVNNDKKRQAERLKDTVISFVKEAKE